LSDLQGSPGFQAAVDELIEYHSGGRRPIIYLEYDSEDGSEMTYEDTDPDELRRIEKYVATEDNLMAIFDLREDTKLEAGLNIAKTVFVCIVLTLGAMIFTNDANELVLIPIERMVERVKRIAKNPLAVQDDDPTDILNLERE
jgi:nitrate/nitrite-specific signal transduction histidine kinase